MERGWLPLDVGTVQVGEKRGTGGAWGRRATARKTEATDAEGLSVILLLCFAIHTFYTFYSERSWKWAEENPLCSERLDHSDHYVGRKQTKNKPKQSRFTCSCFAHDFGSVAVKFLPHDSLQVGRWVLLVVLKFKCTTCYYVHDCKIVTSASLSISYSPFVILKYKSDDFCFTA